MAEVAENVEVEVELSARKQKKQAYRKKLEGLLAEFSNILVIKIDFVGSRHMQLARLNLRGKAVILCGKNTIIRKVMTDNLETYPSLSGLLPFIKGNVAFVFCNEGLKEIRDDLITNKVPAAAKTGVIAPVSVTVPAGPTGLDPGQTTFFQALNIQTKISRGSIEIVAPVQLITKGEKVSASAVALLTKLDIKPFFYGIEVVQVYENGSLYASSILDITDAVLLGKFFRGVNYVAALSLQIGYPTAASIPHSLINGLKKLVAIALETEYEFKEAKKFKDYLENPEAFAAAAAGSAGEEKKEEAAATAAEPESDDESDDDDGPGLFDSDESSDSDSDSD